MDSRNSRFEQELRGNPALLRHIMNSQDGQTLMRLLTQSDRGERFRQAVQSAANGNASEMADCLRQVTESREGAALIARLQRLMEQKDRGRYGGV
ncbi:MAG: hypothetical protein IJR54_06470 [Oscillibacter sp.]|nr:hypothetical protein [Oscillibacter sp.]